jgi:branched-chain amino acid transport system ATP-binding protein
MSLIEVKNVSKKFGGLSALKDLSFVLNKGEILGLIGPNGSGKTTLFNVINGFYQPTTGDVYLRGEKVTNLKPHVLCKLGVARTFQVVKPLQRMTVFDNVLASAFIRTKTKAEAEALVNEILKFTNLYEDGAILSKSLPLGKRKRLEIARALATQPEIILLDESFAGLNPTEINEQIEIVNKIRTERGITILIIEHHMKVIMSISDRILVLNYGQKIAEGTPGEIGRNPVVIEAYLGEAVSA